MGRTFLAAAAAALVVAFLPWSASAQSSGGSSTSSDSTSSSTATRPRVFTSSVSSTAVEFFPDRNNGFTIPEAARVRFVMGDSGTTQSGGPTAHAGILDPGGGIVKGPAQVCGLAGGPVSDNLPQLAFIFNACLNAHWPFSVDADEFQSDASTAGSTDVGQPTDLVYGQGGSAHAKIDADAFTSSTDATLSGLRLNPLPGAGSLGVPLPDLGLPAPAAVDPTVFSIGSLSATTSNVFDGQTLIAHGEAHIGGVHLLGGLVTIDSIVAVAESRSADGQAPVATSSVTVQGVTVAGQKAGIGSNGITFGDSGTGDPNAVNDALNQVLNGAGMTIKLIGATQQQDAAGLMDASAQGIEVTFAHEVNLKGTPLADTGLTDIYTAKLLFGSASTGDLARNIARPSTSTGSGTTGVSASGTSGSGFSSGTAVGAPQQGTPPSGDNGGDQTANSSPAGFLGIDPGRIKFLYLSFTLVALGVCVSPRLTLPSRLPAG